VVGDFVHISSSDEKGYGWNSWYQYSLEVVAGIFDIRKIEVQFDSEVVSGYTYEDQNFEQVGDYTTTGQGFSTTLYFNNGSSLEEVDVDELRSALEAEEGSDLADRARQFLLARNRLE